MKQILNESQEELVSQILTDYTYGDLIPNELLYEKLGLPEEGKQVTMAKARKAAFMYMSRIEGIKEHLLETHKIMLISSRGKGYVLIKPSQQVEHAVTEFFKVAARAAEKCNHRIQNVNTDLLTDTERSRDADTKAHFGRLTSIMDDRKKDIGRLLTTD